MYRGRIVVLVIGIFFMAVILQYHRSDGFLRLLQNTNETIAIGDVKIIPGEKDITTENYLIVYDTALPESISLKDNIIKTLQYAKKNFSVIEFQNFNGSLLTAEHYDCIVVAVENLDDFKDFQVVLDYVQSGGSVFFACRPLPGTVLKLNSNYFGIRTLGDSLKSDVVGLQIHTDLFVKSKDYLISQDFFANSSLDLSIDRSALLHISSANGLPLAWEKKWGEGKFIFYNGTNLIVKANRGLLLGLLGRAKDTFIYPVMGLMIVNIDDFPAPMPNVDNEIIHKEYGMSTQEFYRNIWWPDMLKLASKFGLKYTGLFIESYNNSTVPPFNPDNMTSISQDLLAYGREIIKSGGELGLHGYNHQPLVTSSMSSQDLGYNLWDSRQNMEKSIVEAQRYFTQVFPNYELHAYVPPSNIIDQQGRQALINSLPHLRIIASLFIADDRSAYSQEFEMKDDGVLEIPRVTYGFNRDSFNDWCTNNVISQLGVFSHFVHPDDLLDEQRNMGKSWDELYEGFSDFLGSVSVNYPWLQGCTLSEAGEYLKDFLDMQYTIEQKNSEIMIYSGGYRGKFHFIIRSNKDLKAGRNCELTVLDASHYLVTVFDSEAQILESGGV